MNTIPSVTFRIPATHPSLPGHFPGQPVVPAVLLLDAVAARLDAHGLGMERLVEAKFLRTLPPDVEATLELSAVGETLWQFRITHADDTIARGRVQVAPR